MAFLPAFGNGGKKLIVVAVSLDQHFADQCADSEIAIDLERRTDIQKVGINCVPEHEFQPLVGFFSVAKLSVAHTCPDICPAVDTAAFGDPVIQRFLGGIPKRGIGMDGIARIETVEMGQVLMGIICFLNFSAVFQQASFPGNL